MPSPSACSRIALLAIFMHLPIGAERSGQVLLDVDVASFASREQPAAKTTPSGNKKGNPKTDTMLNEDPQVIDYTGQTIMITDPAISDINPRLQKGMLGHIVQESQTNTQDFDRRIFWVQMNDVPLNPFLKGSQIKVTAMGEEGVDPEKSNLEGKCVQMLQVPARKELQGAGLWKEQYGKVVKYDGEIDYEGLNEQAYMVQMLGQYYEDDGLPLRLFRHEFIHADCPQAIKPHSAPNPLLPKGTTVEIHNPIQGPVDYQNKLLNQIGKVLTWNKRNGMYLVFLKWYGKNVELMPRELRKREFEDKDMKSRDKDKQLKGDCNYSRIVEFAKNKADTLGRISVHLNKFAKGGGPVTKAIKKHNKYVGTLWKNHVLLDELQQTIDDFKMGAAVGDEQASVKLGEDVEKGRAEVNANMQMAEDLSTHFSEKLERLGENQAVQRAHLERYEQLEESNEFKTLKGLVDSKKKLANSKT